MTITATWNDTTYVQQFSAPLNYKVVAPTKVDNIFVIQKIDTSDPSSPSNGYLYFKNTPTEHVIRYRNNGSWETIQPKTRTGDGVVYLNLANGFYYTWDGSDLTQLRYPATYRNGGWGIQWYLKSITTAPTTPALCDSYYNSTSKYILYWNGYSWNSLGSPVTLLDTEHEYGYMWYVVDEVVKYQDGTQEVYQPLLWYNSSTYKFDYRYRDGVLYVRNENNTITYFTIPMIGINGKKFVGSCTLQYPNTDGTVRFRLRASYTDNSGRTTGSDFMPDSGRKSDETYTDYAQGRTGAVNSSLVWDIALNTYPTTADEFQIHYYNTQTSDYPGSILAPLDKDSHILSEKYGITWEITKSSGEGGTFARLTLTQLVEMGYVTLTNTGQHSTYNVSQQSFRLKYSGQYTIYAKYNYRLTDGGTVNTFSISKSLLVYRPSNPSISIVSPVSPDPEVYPPPYTVVLRDTSQTTDPLQVPQQTLTMDSGDNQNPESWTATNPYNYLVHMTDNTHVYNGYGSYRPSLTYVDKNGNTAVAYASFTPNKTGRKYTPAGWTSPIRLGYNGTYYYAVENQTVTIRLDQQGVNVPAMVTLEASVAGEPLPEVTWTYTLTTGSESYTGTITGTYAELSLILGGSSGYSAGVYTIDCSVLDTWQRFTVAVGNEVVSSEADKTMEDFGLIVLNDVNLPIDYCKQHTCPQYTTKWQDSDTVQFELPINYKYAEYLQEGDRFIFGHFGAKLFTVTYRQQNDNTITITGTCVFPSRVAITSTRSQANDGYDVQTASAEALIRYFINASLKDPYSTAQPRTANFLPHGTCNNYGGTVTYSARYENVQDIVNEICNTSGVGYSVGIRAMADGSIDKCQIWIKQGANRIYGTNIAIIFSEALKNMRIVSDQSALCPNVAIGAGNGTGNYRDYTYYNIAGSTPSDSGFDRREVFVDAGDAVDSNEIKRMSVLELKTAKQLSIKIQVLPKCQWAYGSQYDVGDMVTLVHPTRGQLDLQIFSAEHVRRATGDELYLNLGSRSLTAPALIGKVSAANTYARK